MDVFVLDQTQSGASTILNNGQMINGLSSVMWIERYRQNGEFTLIGDVSKGYRESLPIGSFISHTSTSELMRVENHEIDDDGEPDTKIKITGRSFETFMEDRIIGANRLAVTPTGPYDGWGAMTAWNYAKQMIIDHVTSPSFNGDDKIANCRVVSTVTGVPIVAEERATEIKPLYNIILELLAQNDIGIRSVRPGPWNAAYAEAGPSGAFYLPTDFGFEIHNGVDRRREVGFSYSEGDVKSGQYLWTNKNKKTDVYVQSKWHEVRVSSGPININRRVGFLDAKDLDDNYNAYPTADIASIEAAMIARGREYLGAQKDISISRVELKENNQRYSYRQDYNVGDIVGVDGNYDSNTVMRISEFVEIEDENGYVGYPTLTAI